MIFFYVVKRFSTAHNDRFLSASSSCVIIARERERERQKDDVLWRLRDEEDIKRSDMKASWMQRSCIFRSRCRQLNTKDNCLLSHAFLSILFFFFFFFSETSFSRPRLWDYFVASSSASLVSLRSSCPFLDLLGKLSSWTTSKQGMRSHPFNVHSLQFLPCTS